MHLHVQKLPVDPDHSFVARTYRTPAFEVGWHQHIECELILFTEGRGLSFVGNHVGNFETGDIFFLGANLPHTFQKHEPDMVTSAIVVQFKEDFWGTTLLRLPESRRIRKMLQDAAQGLKIGPATQSTLNPRIRALERETGFRRLLLLGDCLEQIARAPDVKTVSTQDVHPYSAKDAACIERVFAFTLASFRERITLNQVAEVACMSAPAFCNYFKRSTRKTYTDFLNEVRIGYACSLLVDTDHSVLDISLDSGYNTGANFHKQFMRIKRISPLQYRKRFLESRDHRSGYSFISI